MKSSSEVRSAFKYLYPDELPFLKRLVSDLPAYPVVVNIGAGAGTSGLAIMETRPEDLTLITIDVTDLSSPFGCLEAERDVMEEAGFASLWGNRWFQIHTHSASIAIAWPSIEAQMPRLMGNLMVDMVFVDGDHSFIGAAEDMIAWSAWLKHGGIMAVHDYKKGELAINSDGPHPMEWVGVDEAVDMYLVPRFACIGRVDSLIAFTMDRSKIA